MQVELDYGLPGSAATSDVEKLLVVCQAPACNALLEACGLSSEGQERLARGLGSATSVLCISVSGARTAHRICRSWQQLKHDLQLLLTTAMMLWIINPKLEKDGCARSEVEVALKRAGLFCRCHTCTLSGIMHGG